MIKKENFNLHKNTILYDFFMHTYFFNDRITNVSWLKNILEWNDDIFDYKNSKIQNLETYKQNIKEHFDFINTANEEAITPTYYQFLALLLTEIHLDEFFANKEGFLEKIYNFTITNKWNYLNFKNISDQEVRIILESWSFNKLVYWMATWSGKTIVMAINFLQFMKYNTNIDNVIIITPDENISKQHKLEFEKFNIVSRKIQFREITKFKREWYTKKTKNDEWSFDAITEYGFSKNLVLVDEWHRSIDDGIQKALRDSIWLWNGSFTFEYSATFWQAVNGSKKSKKSVYLDEEERKTYKKNIITQDEYSFSVIFDYSFKFFTGDLYWKNVVIDNTKEKHKKEYLYHTIKLMLSYVNQCLYYKDHRKEFSEFNLENPLITIFWQKVNTRNNVGINDGNEVDASEVQEFLHVLWDILNFDKEIQDIIQNIVFKSENQKITLEYLKEKTNSNTAKIISFIKEFVYLLKEYEQENLKTIKVLDIKNGNNELWLKVWNEYFGLIYVWTPENIVKNIKHENVVHEPNGDIVSDSLYKRINNGELSMIIWSKRFTTGWNNYRVSTMWLLNVGIWEWSTIIQILWRWVRLKGKNFSLKREQDWQILSNIQSLNIIGLNSNYLDNFVQNINEEWENPDDFDEITFTAKKQIQDTSKLKVFIQKTEYNFKTEGIIIGEKYSIETDGVVNSLALYENSKKKSYKIEFTWEITIDKRRLIQDENWNYIPEHDIILNLLVNDSVVHFGIINKIYILSSLLKYTEKYSNVIFSCKLQNLEDFYKNILKQFKVFLNKEKVSSHWEFELYNREDALYFEKLLIEIWQKYIDKYVWYIRSSIEWLNQRLVSYDELDSKLIPEYKIKIKKEDKNIVEEYIKKYTESLDLESEEKSILLQSHLCIIDFEKHLYRPLFEDNANIEISPIWLNEWEKKFIHDLKKYVVENTVEEKYDVYLMRNLPKSWIWVFLQEGWFYPDFILWIIDEENDKQYISFVDPKWLRQEWVTSAKINFSRDIKLLENTFSWENIILNSFIVSKSPFHWIHKQFWNDKEANIFKDELNSKNILFQEDSKYIANIFDKSLK